ncbi:MAG: O-antigen ligase family protein [Actinomycetota bacterium]|nr:O-antigen ligase family protein [Actinomycetota bacterium]
MNRLSILGRVVGGLALVVAAAAATAGAVLDPVTAFVALIVVVAVLLLFMPDIAAVLAVALLPFPSSLPIGSPVELSATDALIVLALAGWLVQAVLRPATDSRTSVLRPLRVPLVAYGAAMLLSIAVHPSIPAAVTALQRVELVIGGLLLGAGLIRTGRLRLSLELYLVAASLLAAAAILQTGAEEFVGVQKNPAGGFISAALFIAILVKPSPRWILYAPILAVGLLATQSRGALLASLIAAAAAVVVIRLRDRIRLLVGLVGVGVLLFVGYSYLPAIDRARLFRFSGAEDYAVLYRTEFQADAMDRFRSAPWTGVGVGNYTGGIRLPGITDPHQVLIFQLAEGGVPLLLAFLALAIGGAAVVLPHSRSSPLALAALTIQVATVVHALVDIYWVRGTPIPAWLLIGATLAATVLTARGDPLGLEWIPQKSSPARHRRTRARNVNAVEPMPTAPAGSSVA